MILRQKYDPDYLWSQKCSIWTFFVPSKDRVETWHMLVCKAHRTLSIVVWTDPVDQFLWRRIIRNSMRSILKIVSVGTVRPWISQVVPVLKQSPALRSMQNWMGYNLMLEFFGSLFLTRTSDRNTEERTKSETTISACTLALSILFRNTLIISYTQFCRADQALSNSIWLYLSSAKAWRKNTERTGGVFLESSVSSFVGISDHLTFADQR